MSSTASDSVSRGRKVPLTFVIVAGLLLGGLPAVAQQSATPALAGTVPAAVAIETIKASDASNTHPKLLATGQEFVDIKARIASDSTLNSWYPSLIYRADKLLGSPTLSYKLTGARLLSVSEEAVDRAYTLGFAWQISGDPKYAAKLWQDLSAVSTFPDWNPSHFLDTAEMAHAVAIGFDWLYAYLSATQRSQLTTAIESKAFSPALSQISNNAFWTTSRTNWNLISNAGIGIAALAFSETAPSANAILAAVSKQIPNGIGAYSSDGAYDEGMSYWAYATGYLVTFTASLQSATGKTYGITQAPGFAATGNFATRMIGASRQTFSFGDASSDTKLTMPILGLSQIFSDRSLVRAAVTGKEDIRDDFDARSFIWYRAPSGSDQIAAYSKPLDAQFVGLDAVTLRSSWSDANAVSAAMIGSGRDMSSHANLDAGDFVLDALGVNWAVETGGTDQYELPGYLDAAESGGRWNYYRNRPEGQNTLVANPALAANSNLTSDGSVALTQSDPSTGAAVAELNSVYPGVDSWHRGLKLFDSRQRVVVQDEMSSPGIIDAWWFMHTRADVAISADGRSATLSQDGKQILARIAAPAAATFSYMAATPLPSSPDPAGQSVNPGIRKLAIHLEGTSSLTLAVEFTPLVGLAPAEIAPVTPLSQWSVPPATYATLSGISVDGTAVDSFHPGTLLYSQGASTADAVPVVSATAPAGTAISITQATRVPGIAVITASRDGQVTATYRVRLTIGAIKPQTITASTSSGTVMNLADGNILSQWQNVSGDQSATFDYGRPVTIKTLRMFWTVVPAKGAYFEVSGSSNGTSWQQLIVASNWISNSTRQVAMPTPLTAYRFLKLSVHGDKVSDRKTALAEFQAFSADPNEGSPPISTPHAAMSITSTWSSLQSKSQATLAYRITSPQGSVLSVPASSVKFASSDPSIVSVNTSGTATGGRGGTARVTASVLVGRDLVSATQVVSVTDPLLKVVAVASDTYVVGGSAANSNYSAENYLQVLSKPAYADYERRAFLGFNLAGIAAADIESARLIFTPWIGAAESPPATLTAYAVNTAWSESTMTFSNQPKMDYRVGAVNVDSTESPKQVDVTDFIRQRSGSTASFGIRQDDPPGGFGPQIFIRGKGSAAPARLEIRLRDVSETPTPPVTITDAYTNDANQGVVVGNVSGPASTNVLVNLGVSTRSQCPPVLFDAQAMDPVLVQTDASGKASFTARTTLEVGNWIIGTATIGSARSVVSVCKAVVQDPNAIAKKLITTQADGFVQGGNGSSLNFGSAQTLQVLSKPAHASFEQTTFLGYSLAGVDKARVQSATLVFTGWIGPASSTGTIGGYAANGNWTESTLNFSNQPPLEYRVGTTQIDSSTGIRQMDVTDYVRGRAGSNATIALRQENPPGGIGPQIYVKSRESAAAPYLDIRLRPQPLSSPGAPVITSAVSDTTKAGKVTGSVTGPPSTDIVVSIGSTSRSTCPAAMSDMTSLSTQTVRTNASGVATFSATGALSLGQKVMAVAVIGQDRSMLSNCSTVTQNPAVPAIVRVPVSADAHVVGGNGASSNYGTMTYMNTLSKPAYADFEQRAFMAFSLAGINGADVQSAKLVFSSAVGTANTDVTLTGYAVTQTWTETGITFANQPPMEYKVGTMGINSTEASHEMDVTDYIRQRAGAVASFGIRQDDPPGGIGPMILIRSKESATPEYIEITLRAQTAAAIAAPVIDHAFSTAANAGTVTGSASGPPLQDVIVDLGVSNRASCQPIMNDTVPLTSLTVTTDENGIAAFSANGSFPVGASVIAVTTTADGRRSPVSDCAEAIQDVAAPALVSATPTADAHVIGGNGSTTNYGTQKTLQVLSKPAYASFEQTSFIRFDTTGMEADRVESATLSLNAWISTANMEGTLAAYATAGEWSETGLTFENQPALQYRIGTATVTSTETTLRLDLTDYLRAGNDGTIEIALRQDNPAGGIGPVINIRSRESATPPKLDVLLRPSGAAAAASPIIDRAISTVERNGVVSGTISGPAETVVTVDVGATEKTECSPTFADARLLGSVEVQLNADGTGTFEVQGEITLGEHVVSVARTAESRSPLSNCSTVTQNPAVPAIVRVPVSADAHVVGGNGASSNYGTMTYMNTLSKPAYADFEQRAFMAFSLAGINGADVQSAKLVFSSAVGTANTDVTLTGYAVTQTWTETGITFANQPPMEYKVGTMGINSTEASHEMDVTDYIRQRAGAVASFGIRQDDPPGGIGPMILIRSKESATPEYIEITLRAQTAAAD
jgi:hypothetical protein